MNTIPILVKKVEKIKQQNRKNYGWLTESVLDLIVKDGEKSRYDAQNNINWPVGKYHTDKSKKHTLIPIFNKLLEDGYLGVIKPEAKSGGKSLHCGLTGKGLDFYLREIKNYNLSIEQLWQIAFNFFNKKYNYNIANKKNSKSKYSYKGKKESVIDSHNVDDLFRQFEQNTLKISRRYFNSLSSETTIAVLSSIIKRTKDNADEIIHILQNIAFGNKQRLIHNIDKKTNLIKSSCFIFENKKNTNDIIQFLQSNKLVYLHMNHGYRISVFGILFLFYSLSKLKKWNEIDKLISINSNVLPLVFNHWDHIKKEFKLSTENLIGVLLSPYLTNTSELFSLPRNTIEGRLIGTQYDLEALIISELESEYNIGLEFVKNWSKKQKCVDYLFNFGHFRPEFIPTFGRRSDYLKFFSSNYLKKEIEAKCLTINKYLNDDQINQNAAKIIFDNFDALRKLGELHVLINDRHDDSFGIVVGSNDENTKFEPVQNIISFYFYIILAFNVAEENWIRVLNEKFKNSDLRSWWNNWLSVLTEFDKLQSEKIDDLVAQFNVPIQKTSSQ